MTGLRSLTVRQPWASLIAHGSKPIETRSWSTKHRGRIAIHAGARPPRWALPITIGGWSVDRDCAGTWTAGRHLDDGTPERLDLPLGVIVATAEVVDCVPMVQVLSQGPGHEPDPPWTPYDGPEPPMPCLAINSDTSRLTLHRPYRDVTDQLPFGDWTPGRWAWLLDDIQPTTARCPACWGERLHIPDYPQCGDSLHRHTGTCYWMLCPVCGGAGHCDPIPAKGKQGLWTWAADEATAGKTGS